MFPATPHRTAEMRRLAPTPMMHALIACVVDTGTPNVLATSSVAAPDVSAANPCSGVMRSIFEPIVRMMRFPPAKVPSAIAAAHEMMTHMGTFLPPGGCIHAGSPVCPAATNATSASVITPIDFCASFEPCEKAIRHADSSCRRREAFATKYGVARRSIHVSDTISRNATTKPAVGDTTSGTSTFCPSADHLKPERPACATTPPASPPMSACDELDGMPYHHVMRFHTDAPVTAASTTTCVTMAGSAKPDAIVFATAVPLTAPAKLRMPAMITAVRMGSTPVETTVAMALAASWKPLM